MRPPYVFVAGPMRTSGILEHNVSAAAHVASCLARAGFVPFVPQLNILWNFVDPLPAAHWKAWDKAWLERCDALYRIRGESVGADEEVSEAQRLGIPVFEDMESIVAWWDRKMGEHARSRKDGEADETRTPECFPPTHTPESVRKALQVVEEMHAPRPAPAADEAAPMSPPTHRARKDGAQ